MSRCARGSVVFWLLTMLFTGASFCTCNVCAEDHDRDNGAGWGGTSWRDWLLDEDTRPSSEDDSGPLVRRITPKSVFVAPSFSGCSDGYRQDGMGRCVKLVKVNQAAQLDFLLQKLNSKFAPPANDKNSNKHDSGPFHVSIPLGIVSDNGTKVKEGPHNVSGVDSSPQHKEVIKVETPTTTIRPDTTVEEGVTTSFGTTDSDVPSFTEANTPVSHLEINTTEIATPSLFGNDTDHHFTFENTVKRQHTEGSRPFVIVVANSTDYGPFPHLLNNESGNIKETDTSQNGDLSNTDTRKTTVDYSASNTLTTTDSILFTFESGGDTEATTTETASVTTHVPTLDTNTDVSTLSFSTYSESSPIDVRKPTTDTSVQETSVSVEDVEEENVYGDIVFRPVVDVEKENSFGQRVPVGESFSEKETVASHDQSFIGSDKGVEPLSYAPFEDVKTTTDCNLTPLQTRDGGFGRVINSKPIGSGCRPADVTTTIEYPFWTTTSKPPSSYYIRFPVESVGSRPSYSSSSSPNGHSSNGYVRFPEWPSVSSPYRPLPYGSKLWGDVDSLSSPSTSSDSWYLPSASWFPYFQSHKNRYGNGAHHENRPAMPVSTVYRKQYRPSSSSHYVPTWIEKHMSWSHRD